MTREDLAFAADALLDLCAEDARAPYYKEEYLRVKMERESAREPLYEQLVPRTGASEILRRECAALISRAGLTERQMRILGLKLDGRTFGEIATRLGTSRQGAQQVFSQGIKKIARAWRVYPYAGLSDVYRREARRGLARACKGVQ